MEGNIQHHVYNCSIYCLFPTNHNFFFMLKIQQKNPLITDKEKVSFWQCNCINSFTARYPSGFLPSVYQHNITIMLHLQPINICSYKPSILIMPVPALYPLCSQLINPLHQLLSIPFCPLPYHQRPLLSSLYPQEVNVETKEDENTFDIPCSP